jgi:hypothetical protein
VCEEGCSPEGKLRDQKRSRRGDEGRTVIKGNKTLMRHVDGRGLVSNSLWTTIPCIEVKTHTPKNNEKEMRAAC